MSARRVTIALVVVAAVLVVLHVVMWTVFFKTSVLDQQGHWISLLDLDTEASLGTWFSCSLLLLAGILTLVQADGRRGSGRGWVRGWRFLGIILIAASLDEVAGFHESLNTDPYFMSLVGHWTVAGAVLAAVLAIAFVPFLWSLPLRTRTLFLAAGAVYVAGAVGVEFATIGYERAGQLMTLPYNLWNAPEEGLEMAGVILYLYALLDAMAGARDGRTVVKVQPRR